MGRISHCIWSYGKLTVDWYAENIYFCNKQCLYMKILLNTEYRSLHEFVKTLPLTFDSLQDATLLHNGRNVIKAITIDSHKLVIKYYSSISLFNRFVYGRWRQSKSVRAYTNAMQLLALGVNTPIPVAAIDNYRNGVLCENFFISEFSEFQPINIGETGCHDRRELLEALAQFIVNLHQLGIQHNDLNPANVRYRVCDGVYNFELIDNNRMRFKGRALTEYERLDDLRHFSCETLPFVYVLDRYAQLTGIDRDRFTARGILSRFLYKFRNRVKHSIKRKLKSV